MTILRPLAPNAPLYRVRVERVPPSKRPKVSKAAIDRARANAPDPLFPPIDFPVFGLDRTWTRGRWLTAVSGAYGKPAQSVSLAHGDRPLPVRGHPLVEVTSASLSGHQLWCPAGVHAERELAWNGLFRLIDKTMPEFDEAEERRRFLENFIRYVDVRAARWATWTPTRWRVDGRAATARFARFAGGWTAYAFDRDRYAVTVIGVGLPPHGLRLRRLTSAAAYHFDLDHAIHYHEVLAESLEQALGAHAHDGPRRRPIHAAHRNIIAAEPQGAPG